MERVLFINRSYYPDAEATGQLLTELCEDLSSGFHVSVIAGQPNQNPQNISYQRRGIEEHNNVAVRRVWNTRFSKTSFVGRMINLLSYTVTATLAGLTAKRPSVVVVETDPPFLCLLGFLLKLRFRCKLVIYLQDIHPQLGIALGKLREGWRTRLLQKLFAMTYCRADRVVVLGEDMREVIADLGVKPDAIEVIPNWIDTEKISPQKTRNTFRSKHDLVDKFVVMYSGNHGLCQDLENVLLAAEHLRGRNEIAFVFVGDGASKKRLVEMAQQRKLQNVHFVDYQPASELASSLSAADLHLIPVDRRAYRYLMPSKLYGALASGTPVVVVAPPESELARLAVRQRVGMNVRPERPRELAEIICHSAAGEDRCLGLGERARQLAIAKYSRPANTVRFQHMLRQVVEPSQPSVSSTTASVAGELPAAVSRT